VARRAVTATLRLLIKLNCIQMQPSINILMPVAWLFSHSVQGFTIFYKENN
jgi:hypothetical protein